MSSPSAWSPYGVRPVPPSPLCCVVLPCPGLPAPAARLICGAHVLEARPSVPPTRLLLTFFLVGERQASIRCCYAIFRW